MNVSLHCTNLRILLSRQLFKYIINIKCCFVYISHTIAANELLQINYHTICSLRFLLSHSIFIVAYAFPFFSVSSIIVCVKKYTIRSLLLFSVIFTFNLVSQVLDGRRHFCLIRHPFLSFNFLFFTYSHFLVLLYEKDVGDRKISPAIIVSIFHAVRLAFTRYFKYPFDQVHKDQLIFNHFLFKRKHISPCLYTTLKCFELANFRKLSALVPYFFPLRRKTFTSNWKNVTIL